MTVQVNFATKDINFLSGEGFFLFVVEYVGLWGWFTSCPKSFERTWIEIECTQ